MSPGGSILQWGELLQHFAYCYLERKVPKLWLFPLPANEVLCVLNRNALSSPSWIQMSNSTLLITQVSLLAPAEEVHT